MDAIFQRRSIRHYQIKQIEPEKLQRILRAGMAAPSSTNDQEWEFVVIQKEETRRKIIEIDIYAKALETAPVAILVCANMQQTSEPDELFWVQDLSAAAQNMLIEATDLGLGSLWMGLYENQRTQLQTLLQLPAHIMPLILLAFGYAAQTLPPIDRYLTERVHNEQYQA